MDFTDEERLILEMFTAEGGGFDVVLKIAKRRLEFEKNILVEKVLRPNTATNEDIGAEMRAIGEGIRLVEAVFREISLFKKQPDPFPAKNPAR